MTDEHRRASWLADVVLGGQDGLVNVLGVVLGVAAAARRSSSGSHHSRARPSRSASAAVRFTFGAYEGRATVGRPFRSGIQLALIGMASALVACAVGALFQTS